MTKAVRAFAFVGEPDNERDKISYHIKRDYPAMGTPAFLGQDINVHDPELECVAE